MSHNICYITSKFFGDRIMAKGSSGRIVIEVEVELKNRLYSALSAQGMTLKDWFIKSAEQHMLELGSNQYSSQPDALTSNDPA